MPFLLVEILNFQGSIHHIGVGSFSKSFCSSCQENIFNNVKKSFDKIKKNSF